MESGLPATRAPPAPGRRPCASADGTSWSETQRTSAAITAERKSMAGFTVVLVAEAGTLVTTRSPGGRGGARPGSCPVEVSHAAPALDMAEGESSGTTVGWTGALAQTPCSTGALLLRRPPGLREPAATGNASRACGLLRARQPLCPRMAAAKAARRRRDTRTRAPEASTATTAP